MLQYKISASLMCADLAHLYNEVKKLEAAGVDWLHIDIMDGHFVPNFTFGPDIVKKVRSITSLPLDIHLMVAAPFDYIDIWQAAEKDLVCFHIEASNNPLEVIKKIKAKGAKAGLALNPSGPLELIKPFLGQVDMVLLMTVVPGFAGQKWIPEVMKKVVELRNWLNQNNLKTDIQVDGNIGEHNLNILKGAGANIFVAGSASVFSSEDYQANTLKMRSCLSGW